MRSVLNTWLSHWVVYVDNLSLFYLVSVVISFAAVFASWWFHKKDSNVLGVGDDVTKEKETSDSDDQDPLKEDESLEDVSLLRQFRKARQNAIEQKILSTFTTEQLEEERKAEKEQLAAIFQLLNEEKEKFQVNSMEELENQLRLYRQ